jgi:2-polyprenyl-3-methyl-5-hydroxy-6-metoxy-1,4-benzoquinol methylase
MNQEEQHLVASWIINAEAWTQSVRSGQIASRRLVTDQAIMEAIISHKPGTVLDAGCGEGWLSRRLAAQGVQVTGFDSSAPLIEAAVSLGGGSFHTLSYAQFEAQPDTLGSGFDVVVFNFALLSQHIEGLIRAAASLLPPEGRIIVQTLHPYHTGNIREYTEGWREESFDGMGEGYRSTMPWYYRTFAAWLREVRNAGLTMAAMREPLHPETGLPASLLMEWCRDMRI